MLFMRYKLRNQPQILLSKPYGFIPRTFMSEPMGRREIFLTFLLLVEIEGHFTNEFVTYVYETEDSTI
jgi:hypothetical protein